MGFLDRMTLTDIHQLLNKKGDAENLELYLCEYCDFCLFSDVFLNCF